MLKVFIKTFVICIIILVAWTVWSVFRGDGFEDITDIRTEVYSRADNKNDVEDKENKQITKSTNVYFLNSKNEIVRVERNIKKPSLEYAIRELLKGATKEEQEKGIYSEIPNDAKLIGVSTYPDKIIINFNSKFVRGGGTTTIINRIKQLKKTVDDQSGRKPIYLQVEGKQVEYIGGDGVYLEQPLNEDKLPE